MGDVEKNRLRLRQDQRELPRKDPLEKEVRSMILGRFSEVIYSEVKHKSHYLAESLDRTSYESIEAYIALLDSISASISREEECTSMRVKIVEMNAKMASKTEIPKEGETGGRYFEIFVDMNQKEIPSYSSLTASELGCIPFNFSLDDLIWVADEDEKELFALYFDNLHEAICTLDSNPNSEGANEYDSMITNVIEPKGHFL